MAMWPVWQPVDSHSQSVSQSVNQSVSHHGGGWTMAVRCGVAAGWQTTGNGAIFDVHAHLWMDKQDSCGYKSHLILP